MTSPRANDERAAELDFQRWRQHGDAAALGRVFDRLAPELLLVAAHVAGRAAAEDLVQATFLHAITAAANWDATRPLLPWLVGVLANLSMRDREKANRRLDAGRVMAPSAASDPHAEAERHEAAQVISRVLRGMPRHYRQALTLRLVHGLEPLAIAQALGAPVATVKSRLQRGLELLKKGLPAGLRLPAFAAWSAPSLDSVRAAVLAHATAPAVAAGVAATTAAATSLVVGGILLMKKSTLAVVGVAFAATLAVTLTQVLGAPTTQPHSPTDGGTAGLVEAAALAPAPRDGADAPQRTAVVAEGPSIGAEVVANAASVHGRVIDEDGKPLAGVLVLLGDKAHSPFQDQRDFLNSSIYGHIEQDAAELRAATQRTSATGEFTLPPPQNARPHLLVAWLPELGCRAIDLPRELQHAIEIVLPQDVVVAGVVRSRVDRQPIAGVEIHVWPAASGMPVSWRHTDADGRYALQPLPPGDYRVLTKHVAFAEGMATFGLVERQRERAFDFELEPLPSFAAQLVDAADVPWNRQRIGDAIGGDPGRLSAVVSLARVARRAELEAQLGRYHAVDIDDEGRLRGHVQNGEWRVLSIWRGGEKLFEVPAVDFTATRIATELLPRPTVELQVRLRFEPAPKTVPMVEVAISDPSGFRMDETPIASKQTNAAMCTLLVPTHFAGRMCGLSVRGADVAPFYTVVQVPEGAAGTWHEVVLSPADCTVRGVVVGPDGQPAANARLQMVDADGRQFLPPKLTRRGATIDGTFEFVGVPRRQARLLVAADGLGARAVAVDTGSTTALRIELRVARKVDVSLPSSVESAQFRVLDASGLPFADDRVSGTIRHGGGRLLVDAEAASIEVYDAVTGALLGSGLVPADGKLVLALAATPKTKR